MTQPVTGQTAICDSKGTTSARMVWLLALPVLGENLLGMFVGWSDTILTGQILIDKKYLAAITVCGYLLWLIQSFGALIATGAQAIVARRIGACREREAGEIALQSLILAVFLGIFLGVTVWQAADPLVASMNLVSQARALATQYLRLVSFSCPFLMVMLVGCTCLRAAGHTLAGMWIVSTVGLLNIGISWSLALGLGPLPTLGWVGIAAGTSLSFMAGGLIALAALWRGLPKLRLPRHRPRPDPRSFGQILRIGIPGAASSLTLVLGHLWFISIIGKLGEAAMAAHGVAIRCESLSWLAGEAFAISAATLVGQSLGARQVDLARRHGWTAFRIGALTMSVMGVGFYLGAEWLFAIFVRSEETEVLRQGIPVLRLVAFSMPALAACIILTGALRGAGDTRWPLLYNAVGLLLIRIPLAYLLTSPWFSLGLYGAWIAMVVDLFIRGTFVIFLYQAGRWTRIRV